MKLRNIVTASLLSLILIICLTFNIYAKEFKDVPSDYWAKDYIEEVSEKNIIVGYGDNSFKPEREIKKVEALIVLARILGVDSKDNTEDVLEAENKYIEDLFKYDTYATREISYLLKKGIVNKDELDRYIGNNNDDAKMLRKDIVPLVIRAVGKESELSNKKLVILTYKDAELIPKEIRAYVQYLTKEGIMKAQTDDNKFLPDGTMTRAQIAFLASNILKSTGHTVEVSEENIEEEVVEENQEVDEQTNQDNITEDIKEENDKVDEVKDEQITNNNTIQGVIKNIVPTKTKTLLNILIEQGDNAKFKLVSVDNDCKIIIKDKISDLDFVKTNTFATIHLNEDGEAIKVVIHDKSKTVKGTITSIDKKNKELSVKVNSQILEYSIKDDAYIIIDGKVCELDQVKVGHWGVVQFEYNLIKYLTLYSDTDKNKAEEENNREVISSGTREGTIYEMVISKNPKLTVINFEGNLKTYYINKNAEVNVFNKKSSLYDLRLDYKVQLNIKDNEVVKINAFKQVNGIISSITKENKEITITSVDENSGEKIQVLVNDDTILKYNNSDEQLSFNDLEVEHKIYAFGVLSKSKLHAKEMIVLDF